MQKLRSWYQVARQAHWQRFTDVRAFYSSADQVGKCTVFHIAGNKYRLIARVNYQTQRVFVLYILTHAEYDRGAWKQ